MNTLRFRVKLYYAVSGAEIAFALLAAVAGAVYLAFFSLIVAYISWQAAELHLEDNQNG